MTSDSDRLWNAFSAALELTDQDRRAYLANLEKTDPEFFKNLKMLLDTYPNPTDSVSFLLSSANWKMKSLDGLHRDDSAFPTLSYHGPPLANSVGMDEKTRELPTPKPSGMEVLFGEETKRKPLFPERVEGYALNCVLGVGGMGAIYLATQDNPRREVALKVVSREKISEEMLARFQAEYHLLALMSHNHIARIYDAGLTVNGSPYFTMEYVDGKPINEFCKSNTSSLNQRLHLFLQLCEGMLHAHQKTIVHRDLKPSNILVAMEHGEPCVKIIDFGLAKALDEDMVQQSFETRVGAMVGTPPYMSPEQLGGEKQVVDTRSDIYALGVILYELVVGEHPLKPQRFKEMTWDQVYRICREEEPPRPSQVVTNDYDQKRVKGDLDWIVMKAMDKKLERRYSSVAQLKADITCFLEDRPVAAAPPGLGYRIDKFIKRHTMMVFASLTTVAALVMGLGLAGYHQLQAVRAREEVVKFKEDALASGNKASKLNMFLKTMLRSADPRNAGVDARVVDILDRGVQILEEGDFKDPELEVEIRDLLGRTWFGLGDYQKAIDQLNIAFELNRAQLGRLHVKTLRIRSILGVAFLFAEREEQALIHLEAAFQDQSNTLGSAHQHTLYTLSQLASAHERLGHVDRAVKLYEMEIEQRLSSSSQDPNISNPITGLGNCYFQLKQFERAAQAYNSAYTMAGHAGLENLIRAPILLNLGLCYLKTGEPNKAKKSFQELLSMAQERMGTDHPLIRKAYYGLSQSQAELLEWSKAEQSILIAMQKPSSENLNEELGYVCFLGKILAAQGRVEEAEILLTDLLQYDYPGPGGPTLVKETLVELAWLKLKSNKLNDAELLLETARDIGEKKGALVDQRTFGEEPAAVLEALGKLYELRTDVDQAYAAYCNALEYSSRPRHQADLKRFINNHSLELNHAPTITNPEQN